MTLNLFLLQEKKAFKEEKLKKEDKYMWAIVDGVKEKVSFHVIELSLNHCVVYLFAPV